MPRVKSNNIFNLKNSRNANKQQKTICIVVVVVLILVGLFFYLRKNNMLTFMGVKEGFESFLACKFMMFSTLRTYFLI